MFNDFIVRPIFNLLVLIYNLIPGHNFGLAIIIFTIIVRLLMWPLVKRQLHQTKMMRKLQPELKKIKADAKGDKQKESLMMMELYKERGVNPLGMFPTLIVQFIILIGLYSGLNKVVHDPHQLISFAYPALQHWSWMEHLKDNIHLFDNTLFGVVDLTKAAVGNGKDGTYWPAMAIVASSALMQFYQSKQLMPTSSSGKKLRDILKSAGEGKQADQTEVNEAIGGSMKYIFPVLIFVFTVNVPSAISLYWFTGGLVAFIQQYIVLREDTTEMEAIADKPSATRESKTADGKTIIEGEVIERPKPKPIKKKSSSKRKRR